MSEIDSEDSIQACTHVRRETAAPCHQQAYLENMQFLLPWPRNGWSSLYNERFSTPQGCMSRCLPFPRHTLPGHWSPNHGCSHWTTNKPCMGRWECVYIYNNMPWLEYVICARHVLSREVMAKMTVVHQTFIYISLCDKARLWENRQQCNWLLIMVNEGAICSLLNGYREGASPPECINSKCVACRSHIKGLVLFFGKWDRTLQCSVKFEKLG